MSKAYIVTAGTYSEYHIVDVFLDKNTAEAFAEKFRKRFSNRYDENEVWVQEYTIRDATDDVLAEWPDDEVLCVFYDYEHNKLFDVGIESIHATVGARRIDDLEEIGSYYTGEKWFRFFLPISTIQNARQLYKEDKLDSNEQLLKIAQDRYAMAKAYLVEQEEEAPKPIPQKECPYLVRPGVCGSSITVLCGYQGGYAYGLKFGECVCTHPNVVKSEEVTE